MIVSDATKLAERKRRAIGRLIVGFHGLEPSQEMLDVLSGHTPAGVILFARNIESEAQTVACNQQIRRLWSNSESPWISLDQEGGRVRRIKECAWPSMRKVGALEELSKTKEVIRALNAEVRHWGFTGNWAPCADVDSNPDNPVIGDRSFSRDPEQCALQVIATMEAMREVGILPCIKHFPGHGDTDIDSHLDLPWVRKNKKELQGCEWHPFKRAIQTGVEVIMTAHVMFPQLDETVPATMSKTILDDLLRKQFGYTGVIVSDDMEMKAVRGRFPVEEQMDKAVRAGVDAFLVCSQADLQAQCVESLIHLQEKEAEHERLAALSIERLERLTKIRNQYAQVPLPKKDRGGWKRLCDGFEMKTG